MRQYRAIVLLSLLTLVAYPIGSSSALAQDEPPAWAAPPIRSAVSVRDGRSGESISFDALLDALAGAEVVFLGETHTDETTHRVELAVYEGLLERRANQVVLAMEMFERDVQSTWTTTWQDASTRRRFWPRAVRGRIIARPIDR